MQRLKVCVVRFAQEGMSRPEFANIAVEAAVVSTTDEELRKRIEDLVHIPISLDMAIAPIDVAMNQIMALCLERQFDVAFFLAPNVRHADNFIRAAFMELYHRHFVNKEPLAAIAAPACGPQGMNVYQKVSNQGVSHELVRMHPAECVHNTGFELVPAIGAECVAYAADCFSEITPPYFAYELSADGTQVIQDPGTYCNARLADLGFEVRAAWDFWASPFSVVKHGKPE